MNFFNNIIAKESISINGDEDNKSNKNSNILSLHSGIRKESHLSGRSSNEPSLFESSLSIKVSKTKDFNINSCKNKKKRKSGFNYKV